MLALSHIFKRCEKFPKKKKKNEIRRILKETQLFLKLSSRESVFKIFNYAS